MMEAAATAEAPRRGRPRSPEAREKILAATAQLLAEGGFHAVTMEAVAARAGVAKTTVYRWWPNRAAVALACVSARMAPILEDGPAGSYRERFRRQLKATNRLLNSAEGQAITALIGAKQTDPMLAEAYSEQIARPPGRSPVQYLQSNWTQARPTLRRIATHPHCTRRTIQTTH